MRCLAPGPSPRVASTRRALKRQATEVVDALGLRSVPAAPQPRQQVAGSSLSDEQKLLVNREIKVMLAEIDRFIPLADLQVLCWTIAGMHCTCGIWCAPQVSRSLVKSNLKLLLVY